MKLYEQIKEIVGSDTLEIFGPSGSGKTTFVLKVINDVLEQGKKVVFIDAERNLNNPPDNDQLVYRYNPTLDGIINECKNLGKADLYVLDNIGFPIVSAYAEASMKEKGTMLLKCVSLTQYLKIATWKHDSMAIVINQPVSEFNKDIPAEDLPPFGDKSKFGYKEIWRTYIIEQNEKETKIEIKAWRSRRFGKGKLLYKMNISDNGTTVQEV